MGNLDPRLTRAAGGYLRLVVLVVAAAQLGLIPDVLDRPDSGSVFGHPYRLAMVAAVLLFAIALGALTAWAGHVVGGWHLGLAMLIVGGMITGAALAFVPSILYPDDQYPVTFSWMILGAPVGFATWRACSTAQRSARPVTA